MVPAPTDQTLLIQLREEDSAAFGLLYTFYFPTIAAYVVRNHGTREEAQDLFQDAIMVLLHKVREPGFVLTASLRTYLFAIARNLWLKHLRESKQMPVDSLDTHHIVDEPVPDETDSPEEQVRGWLTRISDHCQRVLTAIFWLRTPIDNLMEQMGWKNRHTAANQQYKCLQQIRRQKDMRPSDE